MGVQVALGCSGLFRGFHPKKSGGWQAPFQFAFISQARSAAILRTLCVRVSVCKLAPCRIAECRLKASPFGFLLAVGGRKRSDGMWDAR